MWNDLAKLLHQLPDRLRAVRNHPLRPYLTVRLRDCDGDRVGVDIETDKSYLPHS
jgi:hypothetical protein